MGSLIRTFLDAFRGGFTTAVTPTPVKCHLEEAIYDGGIRCSIKRDLTYPKEVTWVNNLIFYLWSFHTDQMPALIRLASNYELTYNVTLLDRWDSAISARYFETEMDRVVEGLRDSKGHWQWKYLDNGVVQFKYVVSTIKDMGEILRVD